MASQDSIRNTFGIASSVTTSTFTAGVELEIENINHYELPGAWHPTEDGSLRNHGCEFISPPLGKDRLVKDFSEIHKNIKFIGNKKELGFTERTSIHVHVNCLDLSQEQVKSIVLWYALFEPVFFAMVSPVRRNNIHCVGLDQTSLSDGYRRSLPVLVEKWSKYTALNLLPLKTQGTIEFRHMEGHNDEEKFSKWMATLNNLWDFGKKNILTRKSIEKQSQILEAFDCIFQDSYVKGMRASIPELTADSLIDIKLALV